MLIFIIAFLRGRGRGRRAHAHTTVTPAIKQPISDMDEGGEWFNCLLSAVLYGFYQTEG